MKRVAAAVATLVLACTTAGSMAQDRTYPERPVRVIVPWASGGNIDVLTRVVAQKLSQGWSQQLVVENRGGANGMIGSESVVRAAPDGYTLLVDGLQTHVINPLIFPKMAYDTQRDLALITLMGAVQHILVSHPSLPVRTTRDLIALARSRPNEIAYATFGVGTMPHLAGELFQQLTGTVLLHVPYKAEGPPWWVSFRARLRSTGRASRLRRLTSGRASCGRSAWPARRAPRNCRTFPPWPSN